MSLWVIAVLFVVGVILAFPEAVGIAAFLWGLEGLQRLRRIQLFRWSQANAGQERTDQQNEADGHLRDAPLQDGAGSGAQTGLHGQMKIRRKDAEQRAVHAHFECERQRDAREDQIQRERVRRPRSAVPMQSPNREIAAEERGRAELPNGVRWCEGRTKGGSGIA